MIRASTCVVDQQSLLAAHIRACGLRHYSSSQPLLRPLLHFLNCTGLTFSTVLAPSQFRSFTSLSETMLAQVYETQPHPGLAAQYAIPTVYRTLVHTLSVIQALIAHHSQSRSPRTHR